MCPFPAQEPPPTQLTVLCAPPNSAIPGEARSQVIQPKSRSCEEAVVAVCHWLLSSAAACAPCIAIPERNHDAMATPDSTSVEATQLHLLIKHTPHQPKIRGQKLAMAPSTGSMVLGEISKAEACRSWAA